MLRQNTYSTIVITTAILVTACTGNNYRGAGTLFKKPGSASAPTPSQSSGGGNTTDGTNGTTTTGSSGNEGTGIVGVVNPGTGTPAPLVEVVGLTPNKTILAQFANVTGVTNYRSITSIMTTYDSVSNSLGADGSALSMSYSLEGAMGQLGTAFCQAASAREGVLALNDPARMLYPNIPLTGTTATVAAVRAQGNSLIARLTERFWGRAANASEGQMLMTLLNSLNATATTNPTRTAGENLAVALCSTVSQSLNSIIR